MGTLAAASSVGLVLTLAAYRVVELLVVLTAAYRVVELLVVLTAVGECVGGVTSADEG